jgi:hypothetical protein
MVPSHVAEGSAFCESLCEDDCADYGCNDAAKILVSFGISEEDEDCNVHTTNKEDK